MTKISKEFDPQLDEAFRRSKKLPLTYREKIYEEASAALDDLLPS